MADPTYVELASNAFGTKFAGWQQPDEMDPCRVGLGGCPVFWTGDYELRELTMLYSRTPATGVPQDAAMTTHHFLNLTGGEPDKTWIAADYTAVEAAADTFWNAIRTQWFSDVALSGYRWKADGPAFRPFGTDLSPTLRNTARAIAGSGATSPMPPQVAVTVTEVTAAKYVAHDVEGVGDQLRNRWGRFYLPAPMSSTGSNGRVGASLANVVATAAQAFYNTCVAADLIPVMYSPTTGNSWWVSEIHVDDIWDIVRSRRFTVPINRNAKVIDAP